jgi:membrane fusion protein, multidrug efflux system
MQARKERDPCSSSSASLLPLALLVSLGLIACGPKAPPAAPGAPEVSVIIVQHTPVPVSAELPGRTSAFLVAQVRARVDGIVLSRDFQEGGNVRLNQRLYQIDPAPYRAAVDSAQAARARAEANLESTSAQAERDQVLVAANAISQQRFVNDVAARSQAAADVAAARAAEQVARINLAYTEVRSPIAGRIGTSLVTQGAYVQASAATLMATIQQLDPMYVDLSEASVKGIQLRQQVASGRVKLNGPNKTAVQLLLEDGSRYAHPGTLEFTDISVDPGTGSVDVRAVFPNPDHLLLPGMFVRASVELGTDELAMLVPQDGVTHDRNGRATVLVVGPDDKVVQRAVGAARTLGDSWVVNSGLVAGERVIVSGVQRAQPGMLVRPVNVEAAPVTAAPLTAAPAPAAPAAAQ